MTKQEIQKKIEAKIESLDLDKCSECGYHAVSTLEDAVNFGISLMQDEVDRLTKILHKEFNESDELGAEYLGITMVREENQKLKAENKHLKEYETYIYDYVQSCKNTSPLFLGHHLASALVEDHKRLKAENELLKKMLSQSQSLAIDLKAENEEFKKELHAKKPLTALLSDNEEMCRQYDINDKLRKLVEDLSGSLEYNRIVLLQNINTKVDTILERKDAVMKEIGEE